MPISSRLEGEFPAGPLVGSRVRRVEDLRLLTGEGRYVADIKLPRMLHGRFVRSPIAHGRVVSVDVEAAVAMPGVHAVYTARDIEHLEPYRDAVPLEKLRKTPQTPLAGERVRFVGEAVAFVVADDAYLAEDAADAVLVSYEELPAYPDVHRAMDESAVPLFDEIGTNVLYRDGERLGGVDEVFASAAHVFEAEYRLNRYMAAPMETRGVIADFQPASGHLTIWAATQNPHRQRMVISRKLGLPEHKVRVIAPDVGGAFGQKIPPYPDELMVAFAAMRLRRPVKWIEDRRENLLSATHAKEQAITVRAAVDAEGTLLALDSRSIGDTGAYSGSAAGGALVEPQAGAKLMPGVYRLDAYGYEVVAVVTNKSPVGAYRGIGWTASHTARELLFDEIARALEIDPVAFRLKNVVSAEEMPYTSVTGQKFDSGSYRESIERVAEALGYDRIRARQAELRERGRYIGVALTPWVEPTGYGTRIGAEIGLSNTKSHDSARITIDPSGGITVATGIVSAGQGHETTFAQVAADAFGVGIDRLTILSGDTSIAPFGMGTAASRGAVVASGTIARAAEALRGKLVRIAAVRLGADASELVMAGGVVSRRDGGEGRLTLAELADAAHFGNLVLPGGEDTVLSATAFYDPLGTYSNGCAGVVVEVDIGTGLIDLQRVVIADDCGTTLNPLVVEGQIAGAVAQGIGGAIYEELVYDDDSQLITANLMDYLLPTSAEVPPIEIMHLETPSPHTLGGVKGMGESAMIATPATVIAAVMDALAPFGAKLGRLPLTPSAVLDMLREAGAAERPGWPQTAGAAPAGERAAS